MLVEIRNSVTVKESYRVARALALFNVIPEMAQNFSIDADVPLERDDWTIGTVYGPSGSGKTSIARALEGQGWTEWGHEEWPRDEAIIDVISPYSDFDAVTGALASVGLGTVPSWLRPYHVLSNGEKFRASMARLLVDGGVGDVYLDEFTSVIDRRVAMFGAQAFAKAWRRGPKRRVILLTPHFDVIPWVSPDWVIQTSLTGRVVTAEDVESITPEVIRPPEAEVVGSVRA